MSRVRDCYRIYTLTSTVARRRSTEGKSVRNAPPFLRQVTNGARAKPKRLLGSLSPLSGLMAALYAPACLEVKVSTFEDLFLAPSLETYSEQ